MQIITATQLPGDLARAGEVAGVLIKYGLAGWLKDTGWEPLRRILTSHSGQVLTDQPFAVRVRLALTDLGTTFIKLGQVLSTRPDLVGLDVAHELAHLRSGTPADPTEVAMATITSELARPITECFSEIASDALASASVAQVHRARLLDGRPVVVKVQHPDIETRIRRDLNILANLAALAERREELRRYEPTAVVREFRQTMLRELDFRREMSNLLQFRKNFVNDETVVFPKPYEDLTTSRVLTMDFLEGTSVSDTDSLREQNLDCDEAARRGANVFVQMIFRDGFYHADPHPGNILVLPDGKVSILDCGMVGRIDDELRDRIAELLLAAADKDADRLCDVIARVCRAPTDMDRAALSSDLMELLAQYGTQAVGSIDVGGALTSVTRIIHEHKLVMPSRLSMLIKCLVLLEGTGKALSADFNLAELLEPYRMIYIKQQFSPKAWLRRAQRARRDWQNLAESIPRDVAGLLDQFRRGKFSVRLNHHNLETSVHRLVNGLIASALLLSSSLMWAHAVPPTIKGVSVFGVLGYVTAIFLGVRLLIQIHTAERARRREEED
jgi:ubiquinone biosynthesis protein